MGKPPAQSSAALERLLSRSPEELARAEEARSRGRSLAALSAGNMARTRADFDGAAEKIRSLVAEDPREAMCALAGSFSNHIGALPFAEIPAICNTVIDVLDAFPKGSEPMLAQPLLNTFTTITRTTDIASRADVRAEFERTGKLPDSVPAVFNAATPAMMRLDKLVMSRGLQNNDAVVDGLIDACFHSGCRPGVQMGLMMIPKYMASLDTAREDFAERVTATLSKMAGGALGEQGLRLLDDPTWGPWTAEQIDKCLSKHGLEAPPPLAEALKQLRALAPAD
jgi:hypothetical protein